MTGKDRGVAFPGKLWSLAPPAQHPSPPQDYVAVEFENAAGVAGDAEVAVMPAEHGPEPSLSDALQAGLEPDSKFELASVFNRASVHQWT